MSNRRKLVPAAIMLGCFLLIPETCSANPIAIDPASVTLKGAAIGMGIDLVADCLVLVLGYLILRKASAILTRGYAWHLTKAFLSGLIIDFFLYSAAGGLIMSGPGTAFYAFIGFLALAAANYLLARHKERFSKKEAVIIAVLMGILTNPVLFEFGLRAVGFHLNLIPESSGAF